MKHYTDLAPYECKPETTERPILFRRELVAALRRREKTQTRRVMNPQPIESSRNPPGGGEPGDVFICPDYFPTSATRGRVLSFCTAIGNYHCVGTHNAESHCKYGKPGDRLYVKETVRYKRFGPGPGEYQVAYDDKEPTWPTLSGRFMPRWACRMVLELTAVRVEQVQHITEIDSIREGIHQYYQGPTTLRYGLHEWTPDDRRVSAREAFMALWEQTNKDRGYAWNSNPWVWVLTFKEIWRK